jgi:hypothetical protein
MLIDKLRNERDHWRQMAEGLQDQLALSAPKEEESRRSWIVRLLQPLIAAKSQRRRFQDLATSLSLRALLRPATDLRRVEADILIRLVYR